LIFDFLIFIHFPIHTKKTVLANPRKCAITELSTNTAAQLAPMKVGTVVFVFQIPHGEHIAASAARKVVVVHRGEKLMNVMVRKVDAESLLFTVRTLLGKDTRPRAAHQDAKDAEAAAAVKVDAQPKVTEAASTQ